jgi:hypothetical protein
VNTWINKLLLVALFAFSTILVSCGGGSGGGSDSVADLAPADKGTVTLLVTDAPNGEFEEINLTVLKAELLCDAGNQELFSGLKKFDLLQLTNVTEVFSVSEVTSGFCSKIRLTLAQIELVFKDSSKPNAYPKLPGNGKLDLNPRERFYVDEWLAIQLDIDAQKSIHIKGKADYNFRPVVFIKIIEDKFDTKLVRQRGTIENLDGDEFDLCLIEAEVQPVSKHQDDDSSDDDSANCVRVDTAEAPASIFDDFANPIDVDELIEGSIATVVGRFSFYPSKSDDKSSDDKSSDDNSSDDGSSDDDSSDDNDRPGLVLAAEVMWTGNEIAQTNNIACSMVTTDEDTGENWYKNYELPVPDGETVCNPSKPTILQEGAKIYDSEGNELEATDIKAGVLNKIDAYNDIDFENKTEDLKAVLVMLGLDNPLNPLDQLTGITKNVDIKIGDEQSSLELMTEAGDRCVHMDNVETEVFETSLGEDGSINFDQMSVFSLKDGQKADVFGTENNGCLDAEIVIYEQGAEIQPI